MIQKPLQSSKGSCRIFKLNGDAHRDECLSIIERLDVHPKPAISPQQVNLQILLLALTATHRKPTLIIHLHAVTSNVNNMSNDFTQEIEKKKSKRKVKKKNSIRKSKKKPDLKFAGMLMSSRFEFFLCMVFRSLVTPRTVLPAEPGRPVDPVITAHTHKRSRKNKPELIGSSALHLVCVVSEERQGVKSENLSWWPQEAGRWRG